MSLVRVQASEQSAFLWGRGRVGRMHLAVNQAPKDAVVRIHPSPPFFVFCGNSSVGRAPPCHGGGREFESRFPLQFQSRESPVGCRYESIRVVTWGSQARPTAVRCCISAPVFVSAHRRRHLRLTLYLWTFGKVSRLSPYASSVRIRPGTPISLLR